MSRQSVMQQPRPKTFREAVLALQPSSEVTGGGWGWTVASGRYAGF